MYVSEDLSDGDSTILVCLDNLEPSLMAWQCRHIYTKSMDASGPVQQ